MIVVVVVTEVELTKAKIEILRLAVGKASRKPNSSFTGVSYDMLFLLDDSSFSGKTSFVWSTWNQGRKMSVNLANMRHCAVRFFYLLIGSTENRQHKALLQQHSSEATAPSGQSLSILINTDAEM